MLRAPRVCTLATLAALLLAACGGSDNKSPPARAYVALTTGEAAQVVIGQPDFTSGAQNRGGAAGANTINWPWGNPAVVGGRLYLPDFGNNRVLGFDAVPAANGASADFVLAQPNMTSTAGGMSATAVSAPEAVSSSAGKLVLVDADNSRVLVWNAVPTTTNVPADVVVGKSTFTSTESGCDARTLSSTEGAIAVAGKLIVSDKVNNRVLVWNTIPTSSYQPADLVVGQTSFTSCGTGTTSSTMTYPEGVWSDGTRLLVADSNNARVLGWNTFPTTNGQPADFVLGQATFTTKASAVTASGMTWPVSVTSNGTQIAVADCSANRVMVWNAFPTANGAPADVVLGEPNATTGTGGVSASLMSCPGSVLLDGDMLLTGEWDNSRWLIFR